MGLSQVPAAVVVTAAVAQQSVAVVAAVTRWYQYLVVEVEAPRILQLLCMALGCLCGHPMIYQVCADIISMQQEQAGMLKYLQAILDGVDLFTSQSITFGHFLNSMLPSIAEEIFPQYVDVVT